MDECTFCTVIERPRSESQGINTKNELLEERGSLHVWIFLHAFGLSLLDPFGKCQEVLVLS